MMPQYKAVTLNFSRDGNGNAQMAYTVQYPTGDQASGSATGQFAQQVIGDFYPQAMADLNKGQQDNGDSGTGI